MMKSDFDAGFRGPSDVPPQDKWRASVHLDWTQTIRRPTFRVRGTWRVEVVHEGYDAVATYRAHVEWIDDGRDVVFTATDAPRKGQAWTWHKDAWRASPIGLLSFIDARIPEYVTIWDDFLTLHGVEFPAFDA